MRGRLTKMRTRIDRVVDYTLVLDEARVALTPLIGQNLRLRGRTRRL